MAMSFDPYDYPSTFGDPQRGQIIDWSGVTAVGVCKEPGCGGQHGPYFSVEEARAGGLLHRKMDHTDAVKRQATTSSAENGWVTVKLPVSEEARAACIGPCNRCGAGFARDRGHCGKCHVRSAHEWSVLNGVLPEGSPITWVRKWAVAQRDDTGWDPFEEWAALQPTPNKTYRTPLTDAEAVLHPALAEALQKASS